MKGLCYEVQGISHTCNCSVIKLYNSAVIKHFSKKKPWMLSLLQHYTDVFFIKLHKSFLPAISIPTCRHLANQNLGKLKKRTQHFSEPQSFLLSILSCELFSSFSSCSSTAFCYITCLKCGNLEAPGLTFSITLFKNSQRSFLLCAY